MILGHEPASCWRYAPLPAGLLHVAMCLEEQQSDPQARGGTNFGSNRFVSGRDFNQRTGIALRLEGRRRGEEWLVCGRGTVLSLSGR
jgi:hypothetical protein